MKHKWLSSSAMHIYVLRSFRYKLKAEVHRHKHAHFIHAVAAKSCVSSLCSFNIFNFHPEAGWRKLPRSRTL